MSDLDDPIIAALGDLAGQAGPPRLRVDATWRAGRRRRWAAITTSVAGAAAVAVTIPLAVLGGAVHPVPVPPVPGAVTGDRATAYVANGSGTVTPIRTATSTALAPVKAGRLPQAIAITPDGKTAYVANGQSGVVIPIRTATNTALRPIKTGYSPDAIAITP